MNARIYLQPDAVPTQAMIRTANRLFRHFGKEVTFLQQADSSSPDITMNRLRWALSQPAQQADLASDYQASSRKAGNLVFDLTDFAEAPDKAIEQLQALFADDVQAANLVIIKAQEEILEINKADQSAAKRK